MNERIKLLAEQANIHFSRVGILDGDPNGSARMVGYSKMEKFAELIVRDCLAQVARVDDMLEDEPAQTAAVAWVASSIAQHFGVEE